MYRDQLHFRNPIPHGLVCRHKASGPGGRIFDKRSCKGNAAPVCVTNGMGHTGIRDAANIVHLRQPAVFHIVFRHDLPVPGSHDFYIDSLIACSGIAIVRPQEGTDFFLFRTGTENLKPILGNPGDFPCL